jgi:inorganic phosphate transporter, PiT family
VSTALILVAIGVLFLAYSNGANDNFKGVATLFGSGTATYRVALIWATISTFAGSLLALYLAGGLVASFTGKGLIPDEVISQPAFLLAVSLGAASTVLLATFIGIPVSTTHALTGGLVGAGLVAAAGEVKLSVLGTSFVLPLLLSPLVSMLLTVLVYALFRWARKRSGVSSQTCLCVGSTYEPVGLGPDGGLLLVRSGTRIEVGEASACVERYRGRVVGMEAGPVLDGLHYLSAGAVGFARALNDTPKIVALMLAAEAVDPNVGLVLVALVMGTGGVLNSRRVAETMSKKITCMNPGQGFTANLVTSLLVASASGFGLPVSTTHVSVGALFGIGVVNGSARWKTVLTILLAWVTTLPLGAGLAALLYLLLRAFAIGG